MLTPGGHNHVLAEPCSKTCGEYRYGYEPEWTNGSALKAEARTREIRGCPSFRECNCLVAPPPGSRCPNAPDRVS